MTDKKNPSNSLEPIHAHHSHLLCWKSVFAGILISIMSYMVLSTLGIAVLGFATEAVIESERSGNGLGTASALWMGLSAVISLFLGSYFAVRISKSLTYKIGAAHGFVVASSFFIILAVLGGSAVGALSSGIGRLAQGMGNGAANVASNSQVQDVINKAMGNSDTFKSDPKVVSEGIATRLIQGDVQSAKSYYAYQTGLSEAEVSARIDQLQAEFTAIAKQVGEKTASAVAQTGLSLFVTFLVGLVSALIGGRIAAHSNVERPLTESDVVYSTTNHAPMFANQRGSAMPYIFGWLLGVPASILFLIFALRTVF